MSQTPPLPDIVLRHFHSINPNMAARLSHYHWNKTTKKTQERHDSMLLERDIHLQTFPFSEKKKINGKTATAVHRVIT